MNGIALFSEYQISVETLGHCIVEYVIYKREYFNKTRGLRAGIN